MILPNLPRDRAITRTKTVLAYLDYVSVIKTDMKNFVTPVCYETYLEHPIIRIAFEKITKPL